MTANSFLQLSFFLVVLVLCVKPLGRYMAEVLEGTRTLLLGPVERWLYRLAAVDPYAGMPWTTYAGAFLTFNLLGTLAVYAILRVQHILLMNPQSFAALEPHTAFNIAISFASNTNWQNYGGESTLSYFTQMVGLTVQNFLSAASGIAVVATLARGLA